MNGKSAGGYARAAALSAEQRTDIARNAAHARWGGDIPQDARPLTNSQLRSIINKIERHKKAIGAHRDALRDLYADLETIVESADDGMQSLDYAIERLSEHL